MCHMADDFHEPDIMLSLMRVCLWINEGNYSWYPRHPLRNFWKQNQLPLFLPQ